MSAELAKLWRSLSPNQRLMLAEKSEGRTALQYSWFITTARGLDRRGLINRESNPTRCLTALGQQLVAWATANGYMTKSPDSVGWTFGDPPKRQRPEIQQRVAELAAELCTVTEAARALGVTRQAVDQYAARHGIHFATHADLRAEIEKLRARVAEFEATSH